MKEDTRIGPAGGILRGKKAVPETKPRTYPEGRVCAEDECTTVLSRYNRNKLCSVHEVPVYRIHRTHTRRRKGATVRVG